MKSDNSKNHTNRLIYESSPYLLQHAHNPVDWFAWGEEALEKARNENKLILVSVGYAACHWCHVMAHESFENEDIASQFRSMKARFRFLKIDLLKIEPQFIFVKTTFVNSRCLPLKTQNDL